jgi:hypothetical protein
MSPPARLTSGRARADAHSARSCSCRERTVTLSPRFCVPFTNSVRSPWVGDRRDEAVMTLHLPPNDILLALLLATVLIILAAGADLPPEEEPP